MGVKYECHHCVFASWSTASVELYFWKKLPGLVTVSLPVLLSANHVLNLEYTYEYYPIVDYEVIPKGGSYGYSVRPVIVVQGSPEDFEIPEFWFDCYFGGEKQGSCSEEFRDTGQFQVVPHVGLQSSVIEVGYDIGRTSSASVWSISGLFIVVCGLMIPSIGYFREKQISQFYFVF